MERHNRFADQFRAFSYMHFKGGWIFVRISKLILYTISHNQRYICKFQKS